MSSLGRHAFFWPLYRRLCMIRICVSKKDVCKYLSACSRLAWRRTGLNRNGGPCYADKWGIFLALFVATWRKKLCSLYAYAARLLEGLHLSCHPNEKETNTQAKTSELKNLCYHQQIEFILKKRKHISNPNQQLAGQSYCLIP